MSQSRKYLIRLNLDLGIAKSNLTYIHRGRNKYLSSYFMRSCVSDYNYDFRGLVKFSFLNFIAHFCKSLITSLEIKKNQAYIFEGGLHIVVAFFLMIRFRKAIFIMNIADSLLHQKNVFWFGKIKQKVKIFLIRRFDFILTNSPMIYDELKMLSHFKNPIYVYKLPIFHKKFTQIPDIRKNKTILFLITRPSETGNIKGLHIFRRIVKNFYKLDKTISFIVGGAGTEYLKFNTPNVIVNGHFDTVDQAFNKAQLLLCPSIYDAYPCVSIECLTKGVLPIVSSGCGSSSDLALINENFVVIKQNNISEWVNKILKVLNFSSSDMPRIKSEALKLINGFVE
jgi:glycosyltransferase involved in cell wall biosynthesis